MRGEAPLGVREDGGRREEGGEGRGSERGSGAHDRRGSVRLVLAPPPGPIKQDMPLLHKMLNNRLHQIPY